MTQTKGPGEDVSWVVHEETFMEDVFSKSSLDPKSFLNQLGSQPCFQNPGKAQTALFELIKSMQQVNDQKSFLIFRKNLITLRKALSKVLEKSSGHAFLPVKVQFNMREKVSSVVVKKVNTILEACGDIETYDSYVAIDSDAFTEQSFPDPSSNGSRNDSIEPEDASSDEKKLEQPDAADFVGLEESSLDGNGSVNNEPEASTVEPDIQTREELINRIDGSYWGSVNHRVIVTYFLDRPNEDVTLMEIGSVLRDSFSVKGEVKKPQLVQWIEEMNVHVQKDLNLDFYVFEQVGEEAYRFCSPASFREHVFYDGEDVEDEDSEDVQITTQVDQEAVKALGKILDQLEPTDEERVIAELVIRRAGNLVPLALLEQRFPNYEPVYLMGKLNKKYFAQADTGEGKEYFIHEVCEIGFYIGERPTDQIREVQDRREALMNDTCDLGCCFEESHKEILRYLFEDADARQASREEICEALDITDKAFTRRINGLNRFFATLVKDEDLVVESEGVLSLQNFEVYGKTLRKAIGVLKSGKKLKKLSARRLHGEEYPLEESEQDDEEIRTCVEWSSGRRKVIEYLLERRGCCVKGKDLAAEFEMTVGAVGGTITFINDIFFDLFGTSLVFSWNREGYYIPKFNEPPKLIEVEPRLDEKEKHITPKTIPHSKELIETCPGLTAKQTECLGCFIEERGTPLSPEVVATRMKIGKQGVLQHLVAIRRQCLEYFGIPVLYNVWGKGYVVPVFREGDMTYVEAMGSGLRRSNDFGGVGGDGEEGVDDLEGGDENGSGLWDDLNNEEDSDLEEDEDLGDEEEGNEFGEDDSKKDEDGDSKKEKEEKKPKEGIELVDWSPLMSAFEGKVAPRKMQEAILHMMERPGVVFDFNKGGDDSLYGIVPTITLTSYECCTKLKGVYEALNKALKKAKVPFEIVIHNMHTVSVEPTDPDEKESFAA